MVENPVFSTRHKNFLAPQGNPKAPLLRTLKKFTKILEKIPPRVEVNKTPALPDYFD